MAVILAPGDVDTWLNAPETEAARLMQPWPAGRLVVQEARDVDWSAP